MPKINYSGKGKQVLPKRVYLTPESLKAIASLATSLEISESQAADYLLRAGAGLPADYTLTDIELILKGIPLE